MEDVPKDWGGEGKAGRVIPAPGHGENIFFPSQHEGRAGTLGARLAAASRALALIRAAKAIGDLCLPKLFQM